MIKVNNVSRRYTMLFMYYHTFYSWLLTDFRYILTYLKHRELFLKKYFTKYFRQSQIVIKYYNTVE